MDNSHRLFFATLLILPALACRAPLGSTNLDDLYKERRWTDQSCHNNDSQINNHDADGDGYSTCNGDCDDNDHSLSPKDADGDGYSSCEGDCDDNDPNRTPYYGCEEDDCDCGCDTGCEVDSGMMGEV